MEQMQAIERTKEFSLIIQRFKTKSQFMPQNHLFKTKAPRTPNINAESFKNVVKYLSNMLQQTETKLCHFEALLDAANNNNQKDFSKIDNLTNLIMSDLGDLTKLFTQMQELLKLTNSKLPFNVQKRAHFSSIALHIQKRFQDLSKKFRDCVKEKENQMKATQTLNSFNPYNHEISTVLESPPTVNGFNIPNEASCQLSITIADSELRQRERSVKDVEATIVQLGDVFEQFSSVVQEQEELVRDIAGHSNSAFLDIEEAHSQLTKYYTAIKSHRTMMLRVFAILVVLILIFTYVL